MLSSLSLVVLLSSAYLSHGAHKNRHKLVSRIKNYTLLSFEPEVDADGTTRLSFDAFGEHYEVELWRNDAVIPSDVAHTNVDAVLHPTSADSCHYHGRVLNAPSASLVALSMCAGRGIRGRIVAFNETLIVRPSAYYLDLSADARGEHSVSDELLVYRDSDFDRPLVLDDEMPARKSDVDAIANLADTNSRRRLYTSYSSWSPAVTKLAMMIGLVRVSNFKADYGSNWYTQLFLETADMVNLITAWYEETNWGSMGGVGSVRVVLAEVFVLYSFDGLYQSMLPTHQCPQWGSLDSGCTDNGMSARCPRSSGQFDDSDDCAVNHGPWLDSIIDWVYANKNNGFSTTFDNVQFITDMKLRTYRCSSGGSLVGCGRVLGVAYPETMCTGARSLGLDSCQEEVGGASECARTIAHELGHNFGLYHDGQSGPGASCAADEGLMGYSDGVGFSRCSVASMETYFEGGGQGMTCLRDSFDGSVVSNVNGGVTVTRPPTSTQYTYSPTPSPVTSWTDDDSDDGCLTLSGFDSTQYDGAWSEVAGGYDGRAAYQRTDSYSGATNYLFYYECSSCASAGTVRWVMGASWPSSSSVSMSLICTRSSLMDCAGNWMRYTSSFGWTTVYGSQMSTSGDCSNTGDRDSSCSGYSCIFVYSSGVGADGWYYATSACHNGERVYAESSGSTTLYLCFADSGRWVMTSSLCSTSTTYLLLMSATTSTDVLHNAGYYQYGSYYSSSVGTASCSQGFEDDDEDDSCEPESEALCLHGMALSTANESSFVASDGACSNGRAVYSLTVTNASATNELDAIEAVYYVHFADFLGESRWVLSEDGLSTARYLALCDADSVLDCTAGAWSVQMADDDLVRDVVDEAVLMTRGSCDAVSDEKADEDSAPSDVVLPLLMGGAVTLLLIALVIIQYRRMLGRKNVKNNTMMEKEVAASSTKAEEVGDASDDDEENEEEDQEVVIEVEAAFARQANQGRTTTATAE